ncbi:alpha/beta hydrolase family protein [Marinigracilibium pacificum]|uniref:Alpha/beta hydrolase n=1 Tax=Marinigracilibium pacificum TaxID=2729599 RepID=A0A848J857_9BACT|nr:alpha/beta hydrolase [Marinigracilibium pacificum]NMM50670.1 alpha/beta hydrolase [Marinigracilibium pacificum]
MRNLILLIISFLAIISTIAQETKNFKRPQEPQKPYPYLSEDVTFHNQKADITLSGTLTLPKNKTDFQTVILISGSSPHTRDEDIAGHKPFLVIADHLTKNGIGVLRFDDRGVGNSEGKYKTAAYNDRISDVLSAFDYLKARKDINSNKIGLIGHSEGGLIAAMTAEKSQDVGFIILMAAPGLTGYDMILLRTEKSNKQAGKSPTEINKETILLKGIFEVIMKSDNLDESKIALTDSLQNQLKTNPAQFPKGLKAEDLDLMVGTFSAPWFQRILKSDPSASLRNVECPVLAINGRNDKQILPKENLGAIRQALEQGENTSFAIREISGLNHMFQESESGLVDEFSIIEQTFSPIALDVVTNWIKDNSKH